MILLDTHVLVWLVADENKLSRPAASAIRKARASDGIAIADITLWELAFLFARGTIRSQGTVGNNVRTVVTRSGVSVKYITAEIATLAAQFSEDYPQSPPENHLVEVPRIPALPS